MMDHVGDQVQMAYKESPSKNQVWNYQFSNKNSQLVVSEIGLINGFRGARGGVQNIRAIVLLPVPSKLIEVLNI